MGVAGGGVDDVEESFAQDAQGLRVVGLGFGEQELLARDGDRGVDVVGEGLDGGDDDAGLVGEHVTGSEGGADCFVLAVQGRGELDLAVGLGLGLVGSRSPTTRRWRWRRTGRPTAVVWAWAATRSSSSARRAVRRVSSIRVVAVSGSVIDQVGWSVSWSRRAWMSAAATAIGWPVVVVVVRLLMGPLKHRPPTLRPRNRGCPQAVAGHGLVTTFPLNGGGFVARCARTSTTAVVARCARTSTSVVAQSCRVMPQRGQCAARQRSSSWPQAQAASWTAYAVRADGRTRRSVGPRPEGGAQVPPTPGSNAVTTMAAPFCCFSPEPRVIRVMRCSSPRRQRMGRHWSRRRETDAGRGQDATTPSDAVRIRVNGSPFSRSLLAGVTGRGRVAVRAVVVVER